eukprot:CAMPEP_0117418348 /NCGR_PEP_ID=MMETSP0758-20121206/146_1 /TAXON_ID=63605 /ORGANISM="Percolomonas cosmopolitus, Strain AE-1 (ATCC 50343)" /LENGTH=538 /DNA_ID=CAMNT_0005198795 /DNA_START=523 /DNA_END=2139 /DNA_ORIENTATION=+
MVEAAEEDDEITNNQTYTLLSSRSGRSVSSNASVASSIKSRGSFKRSYSRSSSVRSNIMHRQSSRQKIPLKRKLTTPKLSIKVNENNADDLHDPSSALRRQTSFVHEKTSWIDINAFQYDSDDDDEQGGVETTITLDNLLSNVDNVPDNLSQDLAMLKMQYDPDQLCQCGKFEYGNISKNDSDDSSIRETCFNAIPYFVRALEISSDEAIAYECLATILRRLGDLDKAIELYKYAGICGSATAYLNLASIYRKSNQKKSILSIISLYDKAYTIDSSNNDLVKRCQNYRKEVVEFIASDFAHRKSLLQNHSKKIVSPSNSTSQLRSLYFDAHIMKQMSYILTLILDARDSVIANSKSVLMRTRHPFYLDNAISIKAFLLLAAIHRDFLSSPLEQVKSIYLRAAELNSAIAYFNLALMFKKENNLDQYYVHLFKSASFQFESAMKLVSKLDDSLKEKYGVPEPVNPSRGSPVSVIATRDDFPSQIHSPENVFLKGSNSPIMSSSALSAFSFADSSPISRNASLSSFDSEDLDQPATVWCS